MYGCFIVHRWRGEDETADENGLRDEQPPITTFLSRLLA